MDALDGDRLDTARRIFRAYDIRGICPEDIDEFVAFRVGLAFGTAIGRGRRVVVGRDVRVSSPKLARELIKGILKTGVDVVDIGVVPTPVLYYTVFNWKADGGIAVSASHNPPEWNGFKIVGKGGAVFAKGMGLDNIQKLYESGKFAVASEGKREDASGKAIEDYKKGISDRVSIAKKLRVGIDPGNGAYAELASGMLKALGAEVVSINDIRDGRFPSRSPEPKASNIGDLRNLVLKNHMDMGVAFDGDGDRALFVDDKGEVLEGDIIIALLAMMTLKKGEKVVYEVSCSKSIEDVVKERGGIPILSRVGHSYIFQKMTSEAAKMGGEISGHLYFSEMGNFDDGFYAAAKLIGALSSSEKSLSALLIDIPRYDRDVIEVESSDRAKFEIVERVKGKYNGSAAKVIDIDGVKVIGSGGWFLIRASNTSPKIKIVVEAESKEKLEALRKEALDAVRV